MRINVPSLSTGVALLTCGVALASTGLTFVTPLGRQVPDTAGVVRSTLTLDSYAALGGAARVQLEDFPVAADRTVDLLLEQFDVLSPGARLVAGAGPDERLLPRPQVATFRGQVAGEPDSLVFLSLSPFGNSGVIELGDQRYILSSGPYGAGLPTLVLDLAQLPPDAIQWYLFECHADKLAQLRDVAAGQAGGQRGAAPCRVAQIAIETDWEFNSWLFGGDDEAAAAYATALIAANTEIYRRDVNLRLEIVFLRIWPNSNDPWNQGDTINQLYQFQDYWNANMTHIERNVVHFLSGRGLGGGVAYYPGMCYPEYDYALSANLSGYFPYPLQDNHPQNWDLMVTNHENGHIFGAPHTHDSEPPIDGCAWGDCSVTPHGTIMSYCHLCSGGMTNIELRFHPQTVEQYMLPTMSDPFYVDLCDMTVPEVSILSQPADQSACAGSDVTFTVVADGFAPLTYQWQKDGADLSGQTGASLTLLDVDASDVGDYSVVVTNTCNSVTSDAATLDICSVIGDLNGDCTVDLNDLSQLLAHFGQIGGAEYEDGDLTGDGNVDLSDLSLQLVHFGESC